MNLIIRALLSISTIPLKLKGAKIGQNSYIAPGYDYLLVKLDNITIGNNSIIGRNAYIQLIGQNGKITIGDHTSISRYVSISAKEHVSIGNNCLISYNVSILDHDHLIDNPNISPIDGGLTDGDNITIGDDCFIGAHSFILKGVTLGKHCAVGANSVVTKSFPAYSLIAGNPAILLRKNHK